MPVFDLVGDDFDDDDVAGDEFVGDSDLETLLAIAGYDPVDIVGAKRRGRKMGRGSAMARAVAARRAMGGALVQQRGAVKAREAVLGFDSGANIAANANQRIPAQPQVVFRVDRLVVPSDIAGSFTIDDLIVGKNSQFAAAAPVPARIFQENGVGVTLRGDTAQVSQIITLSVTNQSGGALRFRAAVVGPSIE